ncbi:MAG: hypothetical protein K6U00_04720, partial [Armatimonadetes bacterium]|nr:hypothetical protein [Armatimonadota bacterium]
MVNRIALIAVVLTCIAPIGGLVIFASSSGEEPSAQFLAAGMKDQERPGMAIRVTYEYTDEVEYAPGVEVEHPMSTVTTRGVYVRTQGVVALRETEVRTYKNGSVAETITKSSYNRATGEFRQLTETDTGKYGIIASTKPLPGHVLTIMSSMTRYDPLFSGAETPVSRLVEDGTVKGREAVGGKDCWKTELCSGKECDQKDLVWVDPEVGFNP